LATIQCGSRPLCGSTAVNNETLADELTGVVYTHDTAMINWQLHGVSSGTVCFKENYGPKADTGAEFRQNGACAWAVRFVI
jgi:hypothetical protein